MALTSSCRPSSSWQLLLRSWLLWGTKGPASSSPLRPEESPCPRDPGRGTKWTRCTERHNALILDTDCEPTTSSSFMSLADNDHILTVLGSRAGFSADIRVVANGIKRYLGTEVVARHRVSWTPSGAALLWLHLTWLGRLLPEGQFELAGRSHLIVGFGGT